MSFSFNKAIRIHFVGVAGTGMGPLAGLLRTLGHHITGSDTAFNPPIGPKLQHWGIECKHGYSTQNLHPAPDLVVIGNVVRRDNPEAQEATRLGITVMSMPEIIEKVVLEDRKSYVVAGTHGKTTTTALLSFLLQANNVETGYLIGGAPLNFDTSFALGKRSLPFVIEGDEYDSAYFEKTPKFWHYRPHAAILSSVEYDHIDIFPTEDAYLQAFVTFVNLIPENGLLIANGHDPVVRQLCKTLPNRVQFYGMGNGSDTRTDVAWQIKPIGADAKGQHFCLRDPHGNYFEGCSPLFGKHNLLNAVAAIAMCFEEHGIPPATLIENLSRFKGVARRQQLVFNEHQVRIYDDFAHHPTAVRETLWALRHKHPRSKLIAVFEPRSATSCRKLHQDIYPHSFELADRVFLAPIGRKNIEPSEQLDTDRLAQIIGSKAVATKNVDSILESLVDEAQPGDVIAIMSNGSFEGLIPRLTDRLRHRFLASCAPASR